MSEEKISLLNCNFSQKKIRITSPYSNLAIRLIGATLDDLRYLTFDEYIKNNGLHYLEKDLQEERYNHYLKNRLELINEAKSMREDLIREKECETSTQNNNISSLSILSPKNNVNLSNYNHHLTTMKKNTSASNLEPKINLPTSTAILLEREKLQKILEKQENKVKLQIDYVCMIEENRRKNLEKMRIKEIKEQKRKKEKELELMEKKEREREKLLEKKRKEEEMIKEQEKKRKLEEIKEKQRYEEEKEKKEEEEKERKNKILERELKEEEFRQKIHKMNQQQKERLLEKAKELNEKDLKRQKNLEELRKETNRLISEKRLFLQDRMNKAQNKNESNLNEKLNEFLQKQKRMEKLKKQKELEKKKKLREQNEEIIRKAERIKKVLKQYDENNKLKIEKYNQKMEEIAKRKQEKQKEEMLILEEEKRKKEEKEKHLNELRNKFEQSMVENRQKLMDKITFTDKKIKNHRIQHEKEMHMKYNQLYMSREDRKNRVIRRERVKDFERTQKMEQIIERMKKIDNMQKDKYLLEEERKKLENEISTKKRMMLKRLQKVIKTDKKMTKSEIMDFVFDKNRGNISLPQHTHINFNTDKNNKTISPGKYI